MAISIYDFHKKTYCGNYLKEFLDNLSSKNTRNAYATDIKQFTESKFNKEATFVTKEEWESVDYSSVIKFREELLDNNLSPSTINRKVNAVKSFLNYLTARKVILLDISFFSVIKELSKDTKEIPHMPLSVAKEFLQEAKKERFNGDIKYKLLKFAIDTGLRLSEILKVKRSDFQKHENYYTFSVTGKGNKRHKEKISTELAEFILSDIKEQEQLLFPLSSKNVKDMMGRIRKKLGYEDEGYSFHSIRKTAITYAHDLTGDLIVAQRKAGHSNPATTTIYIEDRELPMTGYFSTSNTKAQWESATLEELQEALKEMPEEFLQILNNKLS